MSPIHDRDRAATRGRHRKPRQPRTNRLIRGGLLSGVVGTVAVTAQATGPAVAAQQGRADTETTAELPALNALNELNEVLDPSRAAVATQDYATEAGARQAVETAQQRAIEEAQADAAERREREERRAAAAAAAEAAREAQQAAEAEAEAEARAAADAEAAPAPTAAGTGASGVVGYVLGQLGDGYALGSTGPDAWDCSSLVQSAFASVGVSLPRTAAEQSVAGTQISLDAIQPGDILYWGGAGSAYHVAIYTGDGAYIGAQNSSTGVVERTLDWDPPSGAVRVM
ncbi:C40 family peptidase [Streptomyces sp. 6N223]|uniref:C40 family peptidase n=1 Tax=Streptomyces sp. 6N223 TaxID=3457412 RepID=UPI003FD630E5